MEYADYMEAKAQERYDGHGTVHQRYHHVEFADKAQSQEDVESREDALRLICKRVGVAREMLAVATIDRELTEVSLVHCQWIGPIATIVELEDVFEV